ncbi:PDZ domain-containing protein [Sphingobacterium suaedae]|uniref:PDZ domain-containing protein n=1 Tax=Sphingobacterium suaedae TaxID=1686402 RepID=A0ABW5KHP1_9SPHI
MRWYIYLLLIGFPFRVCGQGVFQLTEEKPTSLKFELINNIILVPVTINGITFSFLLDTGVKETILFAHADDSLYLKNQNKMRFHGIGIEEGIDGILSTGNVVEVGKAAVDSLHWIYVIQASELDISSDVGVAINGILGSKFFNSFAIQVDYTRQRLTLYPPGYDYSRPVRKFAINKLEIENERPYLQAKMRVDDVWIDGKMLIDMGNTDPLMLFSFLLPGFKIKLPYVEEYIGRGFNGAIHGKRNRIEKVMLGDFVLDYPIVAYPDSNAVFMSKLARNRIGSIGSQVLQRFHLLIDYQNQLLYLKKNKNFRKPFLLNMAGMDLKHDGMIWSKELVKVTPKKKKEDKFHGADQGITINLENDNVQYNFVLRPMYKVAGLRKGSPAEQAGIRVGDTLLKINGTAAGSLSLAKIMSKLQSHPGDVLRLTLQRGTEIYQARFPLVDPIPF